MSPPIATPATPSTSPTQRPHAIYGRINGSRSSRTDRPWAGVLGPVDYSGPLRYRPTPRMYQRLQPLGCTLVRLGLAPGYVVVLEVPGRRTGVIHRTLLVRVELDGKHYLVSLAGESEWVRNVRAAAGRVALGRRERHAALLEELPPERRAAVIRAYLHRPGARGRSWGRQREARHYFGIDADTTDARLREVADRYPTFRIRYLPVPSGDKGNSQTAAREKPTTE